MLGRILQVYHQALRWLVVGLMAVSGLAVLGMMMVTCTDVVMRLVWKPLSGTRDMVGLLGGVALACALPYTTAVKGHVAIEYFFHKLHRFGRIAVDTVVRLVAIGLFILLSWRSAVDGAYLLRSHAVTPTLQLPVFWLPWLIALSCLMVALVILYNLTHPGKTMLAP